MTRLILTVLFSVVLCASLCDCGVEGRHRGPRPDPGQEGGQPQETPDQAPAGGPPAEGGDAARISPDIGLCTDLLLVSSAKRLELLGMLKPFGHRIVRETFRWNAIEPEKGRFNWGPVDAMVQDVTAGGFDVLAILMSAPAWAGGSDSRIGAVPPASPADFAHYVEAVASRYKGRIKYYELWNEPNIPRFWGGRRAEPQEFVALLKAGYEAGKRADPAATFIMGGLTKLADDQEFIQAVLRGGGADACDRIGVHLYPQTFELFLGQMNTLSDGLQKMGISKKVWVTEVGWPSHRLDLARFQAKLKQRGITREQFQKSVVLRRAAGWVYEFNAEEARRAQDKTALERERKELGLTEEGIETIVKESSEDTAKHQLEALYRLSAFTEKSERVEKVFWYRFEDRFEGYTKEANFGLVDEEGRPKPSYTLMAGRMKKSEVEKDLIE